jgi:hypothetical protein
MASERYRWCKKKKKKRDFRGIKKRRARIKNCESEKKRKSYFYEKRKEKVMELKQMMIKKYEEWVKMWKKIFYYHTHFFKKIEIKIF